MTSFLRDRPAATADMLAVFCDAATVRAALAFEAALAGGLAEAGLISPGAAAEITEVCAAFNAGPAELAEAAAHAGTLAIPLVEAPARSMQRVGSSTLRPLWRDQPGSRGHGADAASQARHRADGGGFGPPCRWLRHARADACRPADAGSHAPAASGADKLRAESRAMDAGQWTRHVRGSASRRARGSRCSSAGRSARAPGWTAMAPRSPASWPSGLGSPARRSPGMRGGTRLRVSRRRWRSPWARWAR